MATTAAIDDISRARTVPVSEGRSQSLGGLRERLVYAPLRDSTDAHLQIVITRVGLRKPRAGRADESSAPYLSTATRSSPSANMKSPSRSRSTPMLLKPSKRSRLEQLRAPA